MTDEERPPDAPREPGDEPPELAPDGLTELVEGNEGELVERLSAGTALALVAGLLALAPLSAQGSGGRGVEDRGPRDLPTVSAVRRAAVDGVVALPSPSGDSVDFVVRPVRVMERGLAARHPELRSYVGRSVSDPATTIALAVTPLGVSGAVRGIES